MCVCVCVYVRVCVCVCVKRLVGHALLVAAKGAVGRDAEDLARDGAMLGE